MIEIRLSAPTYDIRQAAHDEDGDLLDFIVLQVIARFIAELNGGPFGIDPLPSVVLVLAPFFVSRYSLTVEIDVHHIQVRCRILQLTQSIPAALGYGLGQLL